MMELGHSAGAKREGAGGRATARGPKDGSEVYPVSARRRVSGGTPKPS